MTTYTGSAGADDISVDSSATHTVDGGTGTDILRVDYSAVSTAIEFHAGRRYIDNFGFSAEGAWSTLRTSGLYVTFTAVEQFVILGGTGNDTLQGAGLADTLTGGAGSDTLTGGGGADTLSGGTGSDRWSDDLSEVSTGATVTLSNSFTLHDRTVIGIESFSLIFGDGADAVTAGDGNDSLDLGAGNDTVNPGLGEDTVTGGSGTDTLVMNYSSLSADIALLTGLRYTSPHSHEADGAWSTYRAAGTYIAFSGFEAFRLTGGSGADTLSGGTLADTLTGGAGDDLLTGNGGTDTLDGGGGTGDRWSEDLSGAGRAVASLSASFTLAGRTVRNVEQFTLTFGGSADTIFAGAGSDILVMGAGDDTVGTGLGTDTVQGGSGTDTLVVDYGTLGSDIAIQAGRRYESRFSYTADGAWSTLLTDGSFAAFSGFERFIFTGGSGNDTLAGGTAADRLTGGAGNDTLRGGGGVDVISGGAGSDLWEDDLSATVRSLTATLGGRFTLAGHTITGIERLSLTLGRGNDTLRAGRGADVLHGGAGNDRLDAGLGTDTVTGGGGTDTLVVDYGTQRSAVTLVSGRRYYTVSNGTWYSETSRAWNTIASESHFVAYSGFERYVITTGLGSDTLRGGNGADTLSGGGNHDTLLAGNGADLLVGGMGRDILHGQGGGDRFRYTTAADGGDIIADFTRRSDRLEFSSGGFGRLRRGRLSAGAFQSNTESSEASGATTRFVFNRAENALYYDADGSGRRAAVKIATFSNRAQIAAGDIFIV